MMKGFGRCSPFTVHASDGPSTTAPLRSSMAGSSLLLPSLGGAAAATCLRARLLSLGAGAEVEGVACWAAPLRLHPCILPAS